MVRLFTAVSIAARHMTDELLTIRHFYCVCALVFGGVTKGDMSTYTSTHPFAVDRVAPLLFAYCLPQGRFGCQHVISFYVGYLCW